MDFILEDNCYGRGGAGGDDEDDGQRQKRSRLRGNVQQGLISCSLICHDNRSSK